MIRILKAIAGLAGLLIFGTIAVVYATVAWAALTVSGARRRELARHRLAQAAIEQTMRLTAAEDAHWAPVERLFAAQHQLTPVLRLIPAQRRATR